MANAKPNVDYKKMFGDIFNNAGSKGKETKFTKACGCPKIKAFEHDFERVEAILCNIKTFPFQATDSMSVKELKQDAKRRKIDISSMTEKKELVDAIRSANDEDCSICLQSFVEKEWIKQFPCGHSFHLSCTYDTMLTKARTGSRREGVRCPACRQEVPTALGI